MWTLIIHCDDFEKRPCDEVEDFTNEEELNKRVKEVEAEIAASKYSYYRSYRVLP